MNNRYIDVITGSSQHRSLLLSRTSSLLFGQPCRSACSRVECARNFFPAENTVVFLWMLRRYLRSIYEMISSVTTKRAADQQHVKKVELDGPPAAKVQRKPKITTYAMLLAYEGRNYFGMQMQRQEQQFPTVEMHLLNAMLQHGFITEEHKSDLYPWHFQRAARTDRSVSAVRQICSMHLSLDPHFIEDGTSLLNSSLPADIRVFGIKRVTPSFHAQKSCDGRTYSYTMPTFSLAPVDQLTNDEYRLPEERIAETEELLRCFLGTHNFFNYTSRLDFKDPRAKRTIQQIRCDRPFLYTDPVRNKSVEFVSIYITGQSFIMHQIRKMIGVVLAILRGFLYKSDITRSFQPDRMDIPRAPGLGLLLERLHYNRFENRHEKTHGSLNNWGEKLEKDIVSWRNRTILERILSEECHTQNMMRWLTTLPVHRYILDPEDEKGQNTSELRQASLTALSVLRAEGSSQAQLFEEADVEEDADPELALEEAEAPIEETSGSSSNGRRQQAEQKWAEEGEEEDDVEVETQEGLPTAERKKNVDEGEEEVPAKEAAAAV